MTADLATISADLREQWDLLRAWLDELPDDIDKRPSAVPGWSVADLVAHVGRAMDSLSACRRATPDAEPLTLGEYLEGYARDAERISQVTRELSAAIAGRRLEALDAFAEAAFAQLRRLSAQDGDVVVQARRGPIRLSDMVMTRLIELVVHAEDLAPVLPLPAPVDPTARTLVADSLLGILRRRTGASVLIGDPRAWVLLATGRISWNQGVHLGALHPQSPSDGLPDLSDALPLM